MKLSVLGALAAALAWANVAHAEGATQQAREAGQAAGQAAEQTGQRMKQEGQEAATAAAGTEKRHPLFEGQSNFGVEGKISKVSKSSITLKREGLPSATLMVSKDTKVQLEGEQTSIGQLKQGQDVKASFNLQGNKPMAVEISASNPSEMQRETQ
jgi:hypothetical protein